MRTALRTWLICAALCLAPTLAAVPGARAQETQFESATWEELRDRPYPRWFTDAKLGIFIHWGVYSVPAYSGPED
ncbi:MAG: alpha-L-fucosidase, partial [Gemmatimonadetes bacterium]|nr:alpha-L-fucosidase [Gemmatimonadota bacterium]